MFTSPKSKAEAQTDPIHEKYSSQLKNQRGLIDLNLRSPVLKSGSVSTAQGKKPLMFQIEGPLAPVTPQKLQIKNLKQDQQIVSGQKGVSSGSNRKIPKQARMKGQNQLLQMQNQTSFGRSQFPVTEEGSAYTSLERKAGESEQILIQPKIIHTVSNDQQADNRLVNNLSNHVGRTTQETRKILGEVSYFQRKTTNSLQDGVNSAELVQNSQYIIQSEKRSSKKRNLKKLPTAQEHSSLPPCDKKRKEAALSNWPEKQSHKKNQLNRRRSLTNLEEQHPMPNSMMNWKTSPYQAHYVTTDENFNKSRESVNSGHTQNPQQFDVYTPQNISRVPSFENDNQISIEDQMPVNAQQISLHQKQLSLNGKIQQYQDSVSHNIEIAKYLARASLVITTEREKQEHLEKGRQISNTIDTILNHQRSAKGPQTTHRSMQVSQLEAQPGGQIERDSQANVALNPQSAMNIETNTDQREEVDPKNHRYFAISASTGQSIGGQANQKINSSQIPQSNIQVKKLDREISSPDKQTAKLLPPQKANKSSASHMQRRKEQQQKAQKTEGILPGQVISIKNPIRNKNNSSMAPTRKVSSFKGAKVLYDLLTPCVQSPTLPSANALHHRQGEEPSDGVNSTNANFEIKRKSKHPENNQPIEYLIQDQNGGTSNADKIRSLSNGSGLSPPSLEMASDSPSGKRRQKVSVTDSKAQEKDNFYQNQQNDLQILKKCFDRSLERIQEDYHSRMSASPVKQTSPIKQLSPMKYRLSTESFHNESPTRVPNLHSRNQKNVNFIDENQQIFLNVGQADLRPSTQGADLQAQRYLVESSQTTRRESRKRLGQNGQSQTIDLDTRVSLSNATLGPVVNEKKQHHFRMQLRLKSQHDNAIDQNKEHKILLIERHSNEGEYEKDEQSPGFSKHCRRAITLKAVKMSSKFQGGIPKLDQNDLRNSKTADISREISQNDSPTSLDSTKVKLNIFSTQIPQSLLISPTRAKEENLSTFGKNQQLSNRMKQKVAGLARQQDGSVSQGRKYLSNLKPQEVKINQNRQNQPQIYKQRVQQNSMPPSLTATNVQNKQLIVREAQQNAQAGAYFHGAKSALPGQKKLHHQQSLKQKNQSSHAYKLSRRQIQFCQRRQAEKHLAPKTPQSSYCTRRILFKRRERFCNQNLIIIYFDGVVGDIYTRVNSFGQFRVRHGVFQGLKKLFAQYQIALVLPYTLKRSKVIASYFDKFQGCPVDAIYTVRSRFMRKNPDLKFIDYGQIFEDFETKNEEKLIEKVIVIASRTKDVSVAQQNETLQALRQMITDGQFVDEDKELFKRFLMTEEISQIGRIDRFLFKGCPAFLSQQLEQPRAKINYLKDNLGDELTQQKNVKMPKEKMTATQANQIAVELSKKQKPVTLFVPHTRNSQSIMSFGLIVKTIEDMATFHESVTVQQQAQFKIYEKMQKMGVTNSYGNQVSPQVSFMTSSGENFKDMINKMANTNHSEERQGQTDQSTQQSSVNTKSKEKQPLGGKTSKQKSNLDVTEQEPSPPFSMLDAYYQFKDQLITKSCPANDSLLASIFAIESREVQIFHYKDTMVGRVLLEKTEIKKCYQFTQQKHVQREGNPNISQFYLQLKSQNDYTRERYIKDYIQKYFHQVKEDFDDAKVIRMTAYFMNQFSQKLVADKTKKPNQHLKELLNLPINYDKDLPSRNIGAFKSHRFLILVKNTGLAPKKIDLSEVTVTKDSIGNPISGNQLETIDILKQMGDSVPAEISRLIEQAKLEDPTDWFGKKFYSKPIIVEQEQPVQKPKKQTAKEKEKDKEAKAEKEQKIEIKRQETRNLGSDMAVAQQPVANELGLSVKEQQLLQINSIAQSTLEKMLEGET